MTISKAPCSALISGFHSMLYHVSVCYAFYIHCVARPHFVFLPMETFLLVIFLSSPNSPMALNFWLNTYRNDQGSDPGQGEDKKRDPVMEDCIVLNSWVSALELVPFWVVCVR